MNTDDQPKPDSDPAKTPISKMPVYPATEKTLSTYMQFHESLSAELLAKKDQVMNLIGDAHWGEVGRHREAILKLMIQNHLPKNMSLGTGFVIGRKGITNQIDIIVYDNAIPTLFSNGDFIIVPPDGVRAIIEVKSKHGPADIQKTVKHASLNGDKILFAHTDRTSRFFNGIFAYESTSDNKQNYLAAYKQGLLEAASEVNLPRYTRAEPETFVNHVCFNQSFFLKQEYNVGGANNSLLTIFDLKNRAASAFIFRLMLFLQPDASPRARELYFPYDRDPATKTGSSSDYLDFSKI